jgi:hypothetical protein
MEDAQVEPSAKLSLTGSPSCSRIKRCSPAVCARSHPPPPPRRKSRRRKVDKQTSSSAAQLHGTDSAGIAAALLRMPRPGRGRPEHQSGQRGSGSDPTQRSVTGAREARSGHSAGRSRSVADEQYPPGWLSRADAQYAGRDHRHRLLQHAHALLTHGTDSHRPRRRPRQRWCSSPDRRIARAPLAHWMNRSSDAQGRDVRSRATAKRHIRYCLWTAPSGRAAAGLLSGAARRASPRTGDDDVRQRVHTPHHPCWERPGDAVER